VSVPIAATRGVDLHCAAGAAPGFDFTTPENLLKAMAGAGVEHAVLGPIGRWAAVEHEQGTEILREWCARWPGRFSRWATVNPWWSDADLRLEAMLGADVAGIKLAPALQGFSPLHIPLVGPLLAVAERARLPVYVVSGVPVHGEPLQVAELARQFPKITFILGRSGRTDFALDLLPTLRTSSNIVAETAYNGADVISGLVAEFGPQRVVFASDTPFNDMDLEVARLERAGLDEPSRRAVFGDNARRLIAGGVS
jgi:predicted TIM-barrel fold metal-dependent hydrolase